MDLMIVEDEPRLRHNLAYNIPWEEHGIEVVGAAASGEEAIDMFRLKKPDFVLLDIQMPGMSGLELAKWIRSEDQMVKMIVLSGHDNFQFAQEALEIGISKYLLKPAGDADIMEAILAAADELRRQLDEMHNQTLLQQKWTQHLPHLREMFLYDLLQGKCSSWEIYERSKDIMLDMSMPRLYCIAIADADPLPEGNTRFTANDTSLLQFSVKCIAKESFEDYADWIISAPDGGTAIIFSTEIRSEDTFKEELLASKLLHQVNASTGKLLTVIKECLKLTASAGISSCSKDPEELSELYGQAKEALQKRMLYGNHIAVTYHDKFENDKKSQVQPAIEKQLDIAIETGNREKTSEIFNELWHTVMDELDSVDQVYEGVFYFSTLFVRLIQQKGCSIKDVAADDMKYMQNLQTFATKEQLRECLIRILDRFLATLACKRGAAGHKMVEAVLLLVEEKIEEEVTLHSVAEQLYINSSYLSRLFKKETGKSFSAYVLERKMETAKKALLEGAKVYDAAASTGYRDVSYFTKVFRKYWGITPGEAAKKHS